MAKWRIAGVNFDHFHMGDNLRMAHEHPDAEIVAICDEQPARMQGAINNFAIPAERVFTDYRRCLESTRPDVVILCPATAEHGRWTERVAAHGVHVLVEKPFAASLAEADRMVSVMKAAKKQLAINWPLCWSPVHRTAKRIVDEGIIGQVLQVNYYGGNRGPLWHTADKVEKTAEQVAQEKPQSWFYKRAHGGGSLQDYLGYGTTLGTWFLGGRCPQEITAIVDDPIGLEVDEHCVAVARYDTGLSRFESRWGTFTDPWTYQPQPKCGFVIIGSEGTVSSYDYEKMLRIQTDQHPEGYDVPVDKLLAPHENPVQYFLHCLDRGVPVEGPLSPQISRIGQQIVDSAVLSSREKRAVPLCQ